MVDSVLFLLLSMLIIAASLYLPEHIVLIANRMFYYFSGDDQTLTTATASANKVLSTAIGNGNAHAGPLAGPGRGYMEL